MNTNPFESADGVTNPAEARQRIRELGIGKGFSVINPEDGYRKDNSVWFGKCSKCGEIVSNGRFFGLEWVHTEKLSESSSRHVEYCLLDAPKI
jgi:hypothetical protein